jgi:Tol biopolymer transport system component
MRILHLLFGLWILCFALVSLVLAQQTLPSEGTITVLRLEYLESTEGVSYSLDLPSGEMLPISNTHNQLSWSVDGELIAFLYPRGLRIGLGRMFIYGLDTHTVYEALPAHSNVLAVPVRSPNGSVIAFEAETNGNQDVYILNLQSGEVRNIGDAGAEKNPQWSPDGNRLSFESFRDGNSDVYIVDLEGDVLHRMTNDAAFEGGATWSPDGNYLAYIAHYDDFIDLYTLEIATGDTHRLTYNQALYQAVWSPDGQQIAFLSMRDLHPELHVIDFDLAMESDTDISRLLTTDFITSVPAWSPDSQWLLFTSNSLYVVYVETGEIRRLTDDGDYYLFATWRP